MKLFTCGSCGHTIYFQNVSCVRCGARLGFAPDRLRMLAFEAAGAAWRPIENDADQAPGGQLYRRCGNYERYDACNWMVVAEDDNPLCRACRLNRTIPDLSLPHNVTLWQRLQAEKNRLVYGLMRLELPVVSLMESPQDGLAFDFLADPDPPFREGGGSVVIGHADGVITLNIAEADDAVRERMRQQMAEPYRTILGHFRHESGHYYWDRLVRDSTWLEPFRERFGDERTSYQESLDRHYRAGPPADWPERFVSAYASAHPWEDWAESWAHYLHIVDTLETAWQLGLRLSPRVEERDQASVTGTFDPTGSRDFQALVDHWIPLTAALNSLNHSMGQGNAYPFVLAAPALEKLELVHRIIHD